jgi:hypothetical protein
LLLTQLRRQLSLTKATKRLHQRPKLLRLAQSKLSKAIDADPDDDNDDDDNIAVIVAYREPRLAPKKKQVEEELSDHVKMRLLMAREKALALHRATWGERA